MKNLTAAVLACCMCAQWSCTSDEGNPVFVEPATNAHGLIIVEHGTFTAGTTQVEISGFAADRYEVTYELWTDVRTWGAAHGYTDLDTGNAGEGGVNPKMPVTNIPWFSIAKWCNARSEKDGLTPVYCTDSSQQTIYKTGQININNDAVKWDADGYRLPTEAEWEYTARGGNKSKGFIYSGSDDPSEVAWWSGNAVTIQPVGLKKANELGIYDMSGNAFEYCWDWYGETYPSGGSINPRGPSVTVPTNRFRMARGGGARSSVTMLKVVQRGGAGAPEVPFLGFGFRCVAK